MAIENNVVSSFGLTIEILKKKMSFVVTPVISDALAVFQPLLLHTVHAPVTYFLPSTILFPSMWQRVSLFMYF